MLRWKSFPACSTFVRRTGRFPAGAILLIALGFILLLDLADIISMETLERYWPVGLIVCGIYML